ncbi:5'-deoxynucleotidase hdd1 isoform X2 [Vicia villosa]|uniref:5'-deoxynucleotidase hdd1 isoform X2 n=1 Tax=Vicia villosa TaxID=3911 RepID=UPI00273AACFE|nr:5'-deoxynucleotidase hdd1 isoform X2 [Vicia villosa]
MRINSGSRCCMSPLHRTSPYRSISVTPNCKPFLPRYAPSLSLILVRSQTSGSEGFASPNVPSSSSAIDFLTLCHRLKTTKRKGWVNHGIKGAESIADHMYRMALMSLIASDLPGLCRERCIKIALVHDIAEAIVGDITPSDGVPKAEKSRMEEEALNKMCEVLGGGMRADEIKELWAEYENNSSLEANVVKDFDKVEMILQALEYEMGKFQTELGKSWAAEIISRRKSLTAKRLS